MSKLSLMMGMARILGPDGRVVDQDSGFHRNALTDEGEASVLNVYFREQTNPSKYLALLNMAGSPPTDTTTMAGMTESETPGTDGYARTQIANTDWAAPSAVGGDQQTAAAQKTWTNTGSGAWTISHVALVTAATGTSGLFICYVATSQTWTIPQNASFQWIYKQTAQ